MNMMYSDVMSQPNQLKMSMPPEMLKQLQAKAKAVGVPVSLYLKHIIVSHLETSDTRPAKSWTPPDDLPVRPASKWIENQYRLAIQDRKKEMTFDSVEDMLAHIKKL